MLDPNIITQPTETMFYINPLIQLALLAVLPLIMQGLKKITFIESNKTWLCPLLCIVAATGAAYFMHLPQWLLVGILTGAACNKVYDWQKDIRGFVAGEKPPES